MKKAIFLFLSILFIGISFIMGITLIPELCSIAFVFGFVGIIFFINFLEAPSNNQVNFDYNKQKPLHKDKPGECTYCTDRAYWI